MYKEEIWKTDWTFGLRVTSHALHSYLFLWGWGARERSKKCDFAQLSIYQHLFSKACLTVQAEFRCKMHRALSLSGIIFLFILKKLRGWHFAACGVSLPLLREAAPVVRMETAKVLWGNQSHGSHCKPFYIFRNVTMPTVNDFAAKVLVQLAQISEWLEKHKTIEIF